MNELDKAYLLTYLLSGSKRHQTFFSLFFMYIIYTGLERIRKLKEKTMYVHITAVCHTLHALLTLSAICPM